MTEATATVLLEVDETGEYTCTATPRDGGGAAAPVTTKTSLIRRRFIWTPRRIAADRGATVWEQQTSELPSRSSSPAQRRRAHRVGLEELDIRYAGGATLRCLLLAI